jgi:acyl-CoA thioesterase-1
VRRWFFWLVLFLVGCEKPPPVAPAVTPTVSLPAVLAFGDSLTAGYGVSPDQAWPAVLERKLQANGYRWRVVNAGVSGDTSRDGLNRLDWVMRVKPRVVMLELGANDGLRGLDPKLTQANLVRLVQRIKAHQAQVLLLGMQMVTNMGSSYTTAFKAIYPTVAEQEHVSLMPFLLQGLGTDDLRQADGLHPTQAGHQRIAEDVYPYLIPLLAPGS